MTVIERLQQQLAIRGTASPFGSLAADALAEMEKLSRYAQHLQAKIDAPILQRNDASADCRMGAPPEGGAQLLNSGALAERHLGSMKFNISEKVRVKLTDHGRTLHREDHKKFWAHLEQTPEYRPPKEDADGWSEWQFWSLMQDFGPHMGLGFRTPFETEIEVPNFEGKGLAATNATEVDKS